VTEFEGVTYVRMDSNGMPFIWIEKECAMKLLEGWQGEMDLTTIFPCMPRSLKHKSGLQLSRLLQGAEDNIKRLTDIAERRLNNKKRRRRKRILQNLDDAYLPAKASRDLWSRVVPRETPRKKRGCRTKSIDYTSAEPRLPPLKPKKTRRKGKRKRKKKKEKNEAETRGRKRDILCDLKIKTDSLEGIVEDIEYLFTESVKKTILDKRIFKGTKTVVTCWRTRDCNENHCNGLFNIFIKLLCSSLDFFVFFCGVRFFRASLNE